MRHSHSCAFAHLDYVFCIATPIVKKYIQSNFQQKFIAMQNSVRNMVLHPKLVKGTFSRLIQFTSCVGRPSLTLCFESDLCGRVSKQGKVSVLYTVIFGITL